MPNYIMDDRNIIIAVNVSGSGIIAGYIAFDIFYKAYQVDFSSHKCIPPDTCLYFMQEVFLNIKTTIDASFKELMLNDKIEKAFLFNPSVIPIGISISGQIDSEGSLISASSIIKGRLDKPIHLNKLLEQYYRYNQIFIINNISAAAFYLAGYEVLSDSLYLVLHIGTGVGSKVFDASAGNLIIDKNSYSGEIGHSHVSIYFNGKPLKILCDCGVVNHMAGFVLENGLSSIASAFMQKQVSETDALELLHNNRNFSNFYFDVVSEAICQAVVPVTLATGINKVVICGSRFFDKKSENIKSLFINSMMARLKEYLSPYYQIDNSFIIDKISDDYSSRCMSLLGLNKYYSQQSKEQNGLYYKFTRNRPVIAVNTSRLVHYDIIEAATIKDVFEVLEYYTRHKKVVFVIDEHYDSISGAS